MCFSFILISLFCRTSSLYFTWNSVEYGLENLLSFCRRCYIRFIRKVNEKKGADGQDEIRKAFDFMLGYVGVLSPSISLIVQLIVFLPYLYVHAHINLTKRNKFCTSMHIIFSALSFRAIVFSLTSAMFWCLIIDTLGLVVFLKIEPWVIGWPGLNYSVLSSTIN
jgi:hypothetical protein